MSHQLVLATALLGVHLLSADPLPPVAPMHIVAGFRAPTSAFGPGHRGIDIATVPGQTVVSPVTGVVTFAGTLAGRPVLSIRSGGRLVSMEPLRATVQVGRLVVAGSTIGAVATGGHCAARCLHLGIRIDGRYIPPFARHARLAP